MRLEAPQADTASHGLQLSDGVLRALLCIGISRQYELSDWFAAARDDDHFTGQDAINLAGQAVLGVKKCDLGHGGAPAPGT